jgi:ubiquinone/menaquinone biosynthesis C-methylase UbiE
MATVFDRADVERLEQVYAAPEIVEQRARTRAVLGARAGERGLDVGAGPGLLACELAREVGPEGRIVAIDASPDMVEAARARVLREGLAPRVECVLGDASRLDVPSASFDFVVAAQVLLYVREIEQALAEVARVLRPDGRLAVVDTDWDSCVWLTADRERHRRVMEARLRHFANPHLPPRLPGLLREAGLILTHASVIPILSLRYDPESFSGGIIGTTKEIAIRYGIPRAEADAWEADLLSRRHEGEYFFSLNRFLFLARKS